jgi:hypothetical protein
MNSSFNNSIRNEKKSSKKNSRQLNESISNINFTADGFNDKKMKKMGSKSSIRSGRGNLSKENPYHTKSDVSMILYRYEDKSGRDSDNSIGI